MILKISAVLLGAWGLMYVFAGSTAAHTHPSKFVAPCFVLFGLLTAAGGFGFWIKRRWAIPITVVGLLGISGTALFSGVVLHGRPGVQVAHHIARLCISGILLAGALFGQMRIAGRSQTS